jgi:hypothetical protein
MSNYTYHGTRDLIALPGRSVQTFPSGLVRVDRTYACRASDAGRFRQQFAVGNPLPFDDGAPSIDQMSIFPEPQEERGEDGFVRFRVSAYGRVNTTGTVQSFFEEGNATLTSGGASGFQLVPCINEVAIVNYVVPNSSEPINNQPPNIALRVYVRSRVDGTFIPIESAFSTTQTGNTRTIYTITINNIIEDSPGSVFGAWKEVVYRLRANAFVVSSSFDVS